VEPVSKGKRRGGVLKGGGVLPPSFPRIKELEEKVTFRSPGTRRESGLQGGKGGRKKKKRKNWEKKKKGREEEEI